jgi:hypothetical protein
LLDCRENLEDGLVADTASSRIGGKQKAKRAFSYPGGAGFSGMLPGHQPDHILIGIRHGGVGHREQQHVPPLNRLADDFFVEIRTPADGGQETGEVAGGVRGHVRNPHVVLQRPETEAEAGCLVVPLDFTIVEKLPGFVVVAEGWPRSLSD